MHYPIWDASVRIIHWYLVVAVGVMWWSGEQGEMTIHQWVGCSILCLVLTRVLWGWFGSQPSRFNAFVAGPRAIMSYLRSGQRYAGHNPLGALSVLALLTLLITQAASGLFSQDDILFEAPFAYWAGDWSGTLTEWHALNWALLQGLIALHLLAVIWYQWRKKQPLIQAMVRGRSSYKVSDTRPKPLWLAALMAATIGLTLVWLISIAPEAPSYY